MAQSVLSADHLMLAVGPAGPVGVDDAEAEEEELVGGGPRPSTYQTMRG